MILKSRNSQGFTLVEVLVSIGIMGIALLGIFSMTTMSNQVVASYKSEIGNVTVSKMLQDSLKTPATCSANLGFSGPIDLATAATDAGIPVFFNIPGIGLIHAAQDLPSMDISIDTLQMSNAMYAGVAPDGSKLYYVVFKVGPQKRSDAAGGRALKTRLAASTVIKVNSSGVFAGCSVPYTSVDVCTELGGTATGASSCSFAVQFPTSSCPAGQYANGMDSAGHLLCGSPARPVYRLANHPNPCDDSVTLTYFRSTCDGSVTTAGATCVWYDGCGRYDAGSSGGVARMRAGGWTLVDLPGDRYPATACSGSSNEDGYACRAHTQSAVLTP